MIGGRALGGRIVGAVLCVALSTSTARAAPGERDAEDVEALAQRLDEEHAALATSNCDAACRALGSIQRAAEKICALEPGPRCDAARAKAADATRRVRDACPECAATAVPDEPAPERAAQAEPGVVEAAPRGGCRSCNTTGGRGGLEDLGLLVLAAFGALRLVDRRARRRPR